MSATGAPWYVWSSGQVGLVFHDRLATALHHADLLALRGTSAGVSHSSKSGMDYYNAVARGVLAQAGKS